jgi:hypothetical protein
VREKYYCLVAGGWFVLREKYCWLVADKPNEQAAGRKDSTGFAREPEKQDHWVDGDTSRARRGN